jgi:adenosylcobinamide kinase/adenosylcobinamide-phosphate guanylyltransferase
VRRELILISGGARSGKSRYAVELAKQRGKQVAFIATGTACDAEMAKRIEQHQASRPPHWTLVEEGKDVAAVLPTLRGRYEVVVIDCLGLLISNLLADDLSDEEIEQRIEQLLDALETRGFTAIVVSNEVGSGIVPMHALARRFRDLLGLAGQMIARKADQVILMQMGIPVVIKDTSTDAAIE